MNPPTREMQPLCPWLVCGLRLSVTCEVPMGCAKRQAPIPHEESHCIHLAPGKPLTVSDRFFPLTTWKRNQCRSRSAGRIGSRRFANAAETRGGRWTATASRSDLSGESVPTVAGRRDPVCGVIRAYRVPAEFSVVSITSAAHVERNDTKPNVPAVCSIMPAANSMRTAGSPAFARVRHSVCYVYHARPDRPLRARNIAVVRWGGSHLPAMAWQGTGSTP